jgi:GT2 family glycosyltransferase
MIAAPLPKNSRVHVDGKFFRLGARKFHPKGVAYGPFAPNAQGESLATPEQTARDFDLIGQLGANTLRVYEVPPRWFLDLAAQRELKLLVDIPWNKHLCFLDSAVEQHAAREAVRGAVRACAGHPAVLAYSVANEIPPDVVRWSGATAVADFIDDLVGEAKALDPECLCTFTNYPTTEFLQPRRLDFVCFNVYLHQRLPFEHYLARLQMLADTLPLVLGEFGLDSLREGEPAQARFLHWQIESAFRGGAAGAIVFTFTDDWFRDGRPVADWAMGLTTRQRQPKAAFATVQAQFATAPYFPLPRTPKVSVIVASYNGGRTLKPCMESLQRLNYPDFEVILVDDGGTDSTAAMATLFPAVRCFRHEANLGLSVARNTGLAAATGEIIAFTDSDCRADEDWLHYLVGELLRGDCAGIGGPNFLPPEDSLVAAAVMASPGGPAHVMLTDRQAEHIPGCNMAFYKWALQELGGFDPIFRQAGDDVDLCWRLQQAGWTIGFSPAGFVWHYRRSTVRDYLKQQHGYGEAEALLVHKHPEYFNAFGGSLWRGRIYSNSRLGPELRRSFIYRGVFGSAGFQTLYATGPSAPLTFCTTLEYHVLVVLPLWVLAATFHWLWPLVVTAMLVPTLVCGVAGFQAFLPARKTRWWSQPLVALLFFLQPVVRGWARYQVRLGIDPAPAAARETLDSVSLRDGRDQLDLAQYWVAQRLDRIGFVTEVIARLDRQGWPNRPDIGWSEFDVEIQGARWSHVQLITMAEDHAASRQLLRCRLRARWSLTAKVAFWALLGLELALTGLFWGVAPALVAALLTASLAHWFLGRQGRDLQSRVVVFLDVFAKERGFLKVRQEGPQERLVPAG